MYVEGVNTIQPTTTDSHIKAPMKYYIRNYGHRLINPISRLIYTAESIDFALYFWFLNSK